MSTVETNEVPTKRRLFDPVINYGHLILAVAYIVGSIGYIIGLGGRIDAVNDKLKDYTDIRDTVLRDHIQVQNIIERMDRQADTLTDIGETLSTINSNIAAIKARLDMQDRPK